MKKIFCFIMSCAIMISIFSVTAVAEETNVQENLSVEQSTIALVPDSSEKDIDPYSSLQVITTPYQSGQTPLDALEKGKVAQYEYRLVAAYTVNNSVITGVDYVYLELNMNDLGDLITYTVKPTYTTTYSSDLRSVTFTVSFSILFTYALSTTTVEVGTFKVSATGSV